MLIKARLWTLQMFFDRKTGRKKTNNIHMIKYYTTIKRKENLYTLIEWASAYIK